MGHVPAFFVAGTADVEAQEPPCDVEAQKPPTDVDADRPSPDVEPQKLPAYVEVQKPPPDVSQHRTWVPDLAGPAVVPQQGRCTADDGGGDEARDLQGCAWRESDCPSGTEDVVADVDARKKEPAEVGWRLGDRTGEHGIEPGGWKELHETGKLHEHVPWETDYREEAAERAGHKRETHGGAGQKGRSGSSRDARPLKERSADRGQRRAQR